MKTNLQNLGAITPSFLKILRKSLFIKVVVLSGHIASGQSFVNLGFENTTLTRFLVNEFSNYYATNATVPGWAWSPHVTFGFGDPNTTVSFNTIALDSPAVTLHDTNSLFAPAIQGKYSLLLQGGSQFAPYGAMIQQTGQIPVGSRSISYWSLQGALRVTFSGYLLSFNAISNTPNYTIWGADISAYAGQICPLIFEVPGQSGAFLDNIQFSSSPIPEPSMSNLLLSGIFLFCFRTKNRLTKHYGERRNLFQ